MGRKREGQVIVLSIDAHAAYYQPRRWDGGWYTRDIAEARVYRRPGFAARLIEEFGEGWAIFHPVVRTIDLDSKGRPAAQTRRVCQSCGGVLSLKHASGAHLRPGTEETCFGPTEVEEIHK